MSGRSADLLCRDCESRRRACCQPDPRQPASAPAPARVDEQPPSSMPTSLPVRTTSTRLVLGRETAGSPGRCESLCSWRSVSRCSSAASRGKASTSGRAIQCLPTFARMTASKRCRTHIARRGRSMGATVRGCHAASMRSRKMSFPGCDPEGVRPRRCEGGRPSCRAAEGVARAVAVRAAVLFNRRHRPL
jgi:hypothetical protein